MQTRKEAQPANEASSKCRPLPPCAACLRANLECGRFGPLLFFGIARRHRQKPKRRERAAVHICWGRQPPAILAADVRAGGYTAFHQRGLFRPSASDPNSGRVIPMKPPFFCTVLLGL